MGGRKLNVVTFIGDNKAKVNGYINEQGMVEKVETWIDNPMLGDMLFEAVYTDYKDFGGVKFPTKIVQRQGGHPVLDLTITDVKPNAPVNVQAPQGRGGAPAGAPGGRPGQIRRRSSPTACTSSSAATRASRWISRMAS